MKLTKNLANSSKIVFIAVVVIILIGAIAASYYFYNQFQKTQKLLQNPSTAAKEETKKLVAKVGALVVLPDNEEPTVATITNTEKLKEQPFFQKAQNGDKVLIYTQAKKAILYRESINKIIEVAPVNIGQNQTQSQPVKVALYNGTTTVGLTNTIEKQLKEKITNIEVVAKENANKDDYDKTIVVDISGNQKSLAEQLAKLLNGQVGQLPEDETKPKDADILVILGK